MNIISISFVLLVVAHQHLGAANNLISKCPNGFVASDYLCSHHNYRGESITNPEKLCCGNDTSLRRCWEEDAFQDGPGHLIVLQSNSICDIWSGAELNQICNDSIQCLVPNTSCQQGEDDSPNYYTCQCNIQFEQRENSCFIKQSPDENRVTTSTTPDNTIWIVLGTVAVILLLCICRGKISNFRKRNFHNNKPILENNENNDTNLEMQSLNA